MHVRSTMVDSTPTEQGPPSKMASDPAVHVLQHVGGGGETGPPGDSRGAATGTSAAWITARHRGWAGQHSHRVQPRRHLIGHVVPPPGTMVSGPGQKRRASS